MSIEWDDLKTVLALVRRGSLAAAGAELGVNYTTVARRIARAEAKHGAILFERLSDGYRPTQAARHIATRAAEMEEVDLRLRREMAGQDSALHGEMVLTAPQLLIAHFLAPVLGAFSEQHPEIDLRTRATNDLLDLNRREADLAIRVSRTPGDTLTGMRLCAQDQAAFATPEWVARIAKDPSVPVDWILYESYERLSADTLACLPGSRIAMRFDDMVAMHGAAVAGLGLVRMPVFLGRATPGLQQVPGLPVRPYSDIWVVAHPDVWPGAKLVAFREMLTRHFRANRHRFVA